MAMSATAIRFEESEKDWIQSYASVLGMSFSEFVRSAALDKVEEAADIKAYNEALMEDDGTRYSMDEVMRMAMEPNELQRRVVKGGDQATSQHPEETAPHYLVLGSGEPRRVRRPAPRTERKTASGNRFRLALARRRLPHPRKD